MYHVSLFSLPGWEGEQGGSLTFSRRHHWSRIHSLREVEATGFTYTLALCLTGRGDRAALPHPLRHYEAVAEGAVVNEFRRYL